MSSRKEIFKDTGIYALSSYAAQVLDIINGILVRRFLGPTQMGVWSFLQIVQNYAKHASLGVTSATARDVPYYIGKGDVQKAEEVKNAVFTFSVTTAAVVAFGVVIFALSRIRVYSQAITIGLFVMAALVMLQRIYNLYIVLLRSYKQFVVTGVLNIFSSFLTLLLTILLTWKFQLYGFFAAQILTFAVLIAVIFFRTGIRFSWNWSGDVLKPILALGVSMVIVDLLNTSIVHIDRVMIAKYLGFEQLGFYSVALMAANYLYSLPNMLSIIFFPHLQQAFAKNDDPADLEKYMRLPTLVISYLFPFLIAAVWVGSIWFVPIVLPKYEAGIPALKWVVLGTFFQALGHSFTSFLITVKKQWKLIPLQIALIAFGFLFTYVLIKAGWGLIGIAAADMAISLLQFVMLSMAALSQIHRFSKIFLLYAKVLAVFLYMSTALFLTDALFASSPQIWLFYLIRFVSLCIIFIPLLFFCEKEAGVFSTIKHLLGEWKSKFSARSAPSA